MDLNEQINRLISEMDEIGQRPDYKRGGNYNDLVEYKRLRDVILDLCLSAFREGKRFPDGAKE